VRISAAVGRDARTLWKRCAVNGRPDAARIRTVVDALLESRRREAPAVLGQFLKLLRLDAGRRAARVVSAAPLDDAERADIRGSLARRYGTAFTADFIVDPALIGGMRVTIGNEIYDGSVRARLAALEAALSPPAA
jgi:F-type H+-transporting ATPase subunit delta